MAALEADKRRAVIAAFRADLRKMESRAITIYRDVVEAGLAEAHRSSEPSSRQWSSSGN